jgi:iron(III) transport system substrate-binding protein
VGAALACLLALSACMSSGSTSAASGSSASAGASGSSGVTATAQKEGTLTWYTSIPTAVATNVANAFKAKYGIAVNIVDETSGPMGARFSSEMTSGNSPADLLTIADPVFMSTASTKGWLATLSSAEIPALSTWPASGVTANQYILVGIQALGIMYNSTKLKASQVTSWQALTSKALTGNLDLVNPKGITSYLSLLQLLDKTYGDQFLRKIAAAHPALIDTGTDAAQQIVAGSRLGAFPSGPASIIGLKAQGAPIDLAVPTPTTGIEQFTAVSAKAPHPAAAELLAGYLMSQAGQEIFNKGTASSPLGNLPGTIPLPSGYQAPDITSTLKDEQKLLSLIGQ